MKSIKEMSKEEQDQIADTIIAMSKDMLRAIVHNISAYREDEKSLAMISAAIVMSVKDLDHACEQNGKFSKTVQQTLALSDELHPEHRTLQ
jgi:hypothetical protein